MIEIAFLRAVRTAYQVVTTVDDEKQQPKDKLSIMVAQAYMANMTEKRDAKRRA